MAKRFAAGNTRTVHKTGAVPIPPEILAGAQYHLAGALQEAQAFMAKVEAQWGVETYRLTVAKFQALMAKFHLEAQANARQAAEQINVRALTALSGSQTVTSSQFRFYADLPAFDKHLQQYVGQDALYFRIYQNAMDEFIPIVKYELSNILSKAAALQKDGAFPAQYVRPMLYLANNIDISQSDRIGVRPYFAGLILPNLETVLGNYDQFKLAFHHGALLAAQKRGKGRLFREMRSDITEGPVEVDSLQQKNASRRYLYWKAVSERRTSFQLRTRDNSRESVFYIDPFTRKFKEDVPTQVINIPIKPGAWDKTIAARLYVWNQLGKAPQWLLLEHGQPRWKPSVKTGGFSHPGGNQPANITGEWVKQLSIQWDAIVRKNWDAQIEKFNNTPVPKILTIAPNESPLTPKINKIEIENLIRVTSAQYGTSYYSYNEYLNRRVNQFFQLGDKWVRTTQLEFFNLVKSRYIGR